MMHEKNSKILRGASVTNSGTSASNHNIAISVLAILPARMFFADNKMLIFPYCKARLITKE
jgi:hypothetical protein